MDLNRLRVFRAVVASGSIRGAAAALGYSPASVSQQVAQLRRQTGVDLLRRVGRGIEPTPEGSALAARLDDFFAEVAELESYVAGLRSGCRSTFTMAYFSSLGTAWMPQVLAALTRDFPDVRVDLHVRDTYQPHARPRADLQLVAHASHLHPPSGYDLVEITTDPYVVALPADHPLADGETPLPIGSLRDERWIDTNAGQGSCRQIALDACVAAGFRPLLHVQAQDYATALALVAAGNGLAVLPTLGARQPPPGTHLRPLAPPVPARRITALVSTAHRTQPVVSRALELLLEAAAR